MSKPLDFEFYVGGLESAILHRLKHGDPSLSKPGMTGVNKFAAYAGELQRDEITNALKIYGSKLPVVLVAYGSGKDEPNTATGNLDGESIEIKHKPSFVVIVACKNIPPRPTTDKRMVAEVRGLLSGVQFQANVAEEGEPETLEYLNHSPLLPAGVETVIRVSDLTALAVSFTTSFTEWTPSRQTVITATAEEILLKIRPEGENNIAAAEGLPGVEGEIKNL